MKLSLQIYGLGDEKTADLHTLIFANYRKFDKFASVAHFFTTSYLGPSRQVIVVVDIDTRIEIATLFR